MNAIVNLYRRFDLLSRRTGVKIALSIIWTAIIGALLGWLIVSKPDWAATFLVRGSARPVLWAAVAVVWMLGIIWLHLFAPFLVVLIATLFGVALFALFDAWSAAFTLASMGVLAFTFILLTRLLLIVFRWPYQPLAVAHTLVKEAMRLRISLFFIVILVIALPLIPHFVQETELRYRIQAFINWSLGLTFFLAACMTIFLGCATVAFEIRDRQIWQVMSKPVARVNYLLGKWIGVLGLNAVLLIVAGVSIFGVINYMKDMPASSIRDARLVQDTVLTARVDALPTYEQLTREQLRDRVNQQIDNDQMLSQAIEMGMRDEFQVQRELARQVNEEFMKAQREVQPQFPRTYVFDGLGYARESDSILELKYKFFIGASDTHKNFWVTFELPNTNVPPISEEYVPTMTNTIPIPASAVDEDGKLTMNVYSGRLYSSGTFQPAEYPIVFDMDGLQIFYKVGEFAPNFLRAVVVIWIKLAFLGILGIAASTLLSFPVACLLTFTIFFASLLAPFLSVSLNEFYILHWYRFDRAIVKGIGELLVLLFGSFGDFNPTSSLVQGLLIPWWQVVKCFLILGLLWSGISMGLGFIFFRERELAVYSGHG